MKILEIEYQKNQNWSREFTKLLAHKIGLSICQVYKWNWDQKKKDNSEQEIPKLSIS